MKEAIMKILVFSDSHGAGYKMKKAALAHPDAKMFIFLGDGLRDADSFFDEYSHIPHVGVRGNCDMYSSFGGESYLDEQTVEVEGVRIFCCHGHKYGVKRGLMALCEEAKRRGCDIALYGHTHDSLITEMDGVTLINPGSARYPAGEGGSYCYLVINKDKATPVIVGESVR